MTKKILYYLFGVSVCCYFWAAFAYAGGFFINVVVPKSIDSGQEGPLGTSFVINSLLLLSFGIQHSVMARKTFKKWWTRVIPEPLERSTYVLFASAIVWITMIYWQPMKSVIWEVQNAYLKYGLYALYFMGAAIAMYSIFVLSHLDYVGIRQIHLHFKSGKYIPLNFKTPTLYRYVRHPMTIGVIIFFWATPTMTAGHLLFAAGMTVYAVIGLKLEERDLVEKYGGEYIDYQQKVGMYLPTHKGSAD